MINNKKIKRKKDFETDCDKCLFKKTIAVMCNDCKKVFCFECWHTFKVHDFGYRLHDKKNVYTSNYCGICMVEGIDNPPDVESKDVPTIGVDEEGKYYDHLPLSDETIV